MTQIVRHSAKFLPYFFKFSGYFIYRGVKMFIFVIKKIRNQKKIKLKELCLKTKLSRSYLTKLENNHLNTCSLETLKKISDAIEVNIKDLFYTTADIDDLKEELNEIVDVYGLNSEEVTEISQLIDSLINIMNKEI